MKRFFEKIYNIYWGLPKLTKTILPIIIIEHLVIAFCLNISAFFKKVYHMHFDSIGQFISLFYAGCFVGALVGGLLTTKFRTTKISGIGLILMSIAFMSLFYSINTWVLSVSMFSLGALGAMSTTSNTASLVRSVKDNENLKLKVISLELILFNLSFSLVSFILLDLNPEQIYFFVKALSLLLLMTGCWAIYYCRDKVFYPVISRHSNQATSALFLPEKKKEFVILMSMILCVGLIFSMVKVVFTPTLIERFGSNYIAATAASINPLVLFFLQPLIIDSIKKKNSSWFLGVGGFLIGLGYFLFGMVDSFSMTVVVLTLLTVGEMMFSPLSKHFNIQLYKKGQEGVASGVWRAVFLGSGIIGPEISGYLAESQNAFWVWFLCVILGLICLFLSVLLCKVKDKGIMSKVALIKYR